MASFKVDGEGSIFTGRTGLGTPLSPLNTRPSSNIAPGARPQLLEISPGLFMAECKGLDGMVEDPNRLLMRGSFGPMYLIAPRGSGAASQAGQGAMGHFTSNVDF